MKRKRALQFAWVIAWHILRPAFTVGLASFIAFMEGLYFATRRETYLRISIIVNSGNRRRGPAGAWENRPIQRTSISPDRTRLSARRWMHKAVAWGRGATLCVLVLMLAACGGNTHLTFLNPQGPVADAQRWHFFEVLGIMTVLVAGPIFLLLPLFAWRYRYGTKHPRYTPKWEFSRALEIAAWGGPIVIVALLAVFVWRNTHALDPYKPLASDQPQLRVQVIGYDWKWLFIYPDEGIASIGDAGDARRAAGGDAANLRHGDAVAADTGAGQPDLCHGRHGHAAASCRPTSPGDSWARTPCTTATAFTSRSSPRSR